MYKPLDTDPEFFLMFEWNFLELQVMLIAFCPATEHHREQHGSILFTPCHLYILPSLLPVGGSQIGRRGFGHSPARALRRQSSMTI